MYIGFILRLKQGSYSTEGFRLPIEGFPDDFPENKYLAEIEVASKDKLVLKLNIFLDITSIWSTNLKIKNK